MGLQAEGNSLQKASEVAQHQQNPVYSETVALASIQNTPIQASLVGLHPGQLHKWVVPQLHLQSVERGA